MAKSPIKAGADDRIPPSQECSPHPGKKQQRKQRNTNSKNAKNGECRPITTVQMSHKKTGRTQRQLHRTMPKNEASGKQETPSKQGKSRDPNLRSETSETTASVNWRQGACHQT